MNRKFLVAAMVLALAGLGIWRFGQNSAFQSGPGVPPVLPPTSPDNSTSFTNPSLPAITASSPATLAGQAGERPPPPAVATNLPAQAILQNARRAILQYAQVYGSNPVGTNPEITAALTGKNPKQINFVPPDAGLQVNQQGEMLDAWGTPLFFHQLSAHDMEIRSAGEDRRMGTFDDLVLH